MSIENRLYINVQSEFQEYAPTVIIFQHNRESEFKVNLLDARLQDYNGMMIESLPQLHQQTERAIDEYVQKHRLEGLRVTVINRQGTVVYDNMYKDYARTGNHLDRKEVKQAWENGNGHDISRLSTTLNHTYFYSATYIPQNGYTLRSALPYNIALSETLKAELHYVWFALLVMALLVFLL